ncbi:MAG: hypothetical protein E7612_01580 [Ruminococcaceae bacterium]|nr:hypothetical protein [Oscillospiraceae bacterium]
MKFLIFTEQTLTLLFWVILTFGFDTPSVAILTVIAALIHEAGHILVLYTLNKSSCALPRAKLSGFRIKTGILSYKEELYSALAGPLFNLWTGAFSLLISKSPLLSIFSLLNFMTAISNLLPIKGYDGYKALSCFLMIISRDGSKFESVLRLISFLLSCLLTFFSLFLILKIGEGYWIFFIFFSILFSEIVDNIKYTIYEQNEDFRRF